MNGRGFTNSIINLRVDRSLFEIRCNFALSVKPFEVRHRCISSVSVSQTIVALLLYSYYARNGMSFSDCCPKHLYSLNCHSIAINSKPFKAITDPEWAKRTYRSLVFVLTVSSWVGVRPERSLSMSLSPKIGSNLKHRINRMRKQLVKAMSIVWQMRRIPQTIRAIVETRLSYRVKRMPEWETTTDVNGVTHWSTHCARLETRDSTSLINIECSPDSQTECHWVSHWRAHRLTNKTDSKQITQISMNKNIDEKSEYNCVEPLYSPFDNSLLWSDDSP